MSQFKDRFAQILDELNITNYRIAKDLEVSKSTIGNYISGESSPNSTKMNKILDYLDHKGVSKEWLLTGEGEKMKGAVLENKVEYDNLEEKVAAKVMEELAPFIGEMTDKVLGGLLELTMSLDRVRSEQEAIKEKQDLINELQKKLQDSQDKTHHLIESKR